MLTPDLLRSIRRVYRAMATPLVGHMDPWFRLHGRDANPDAPRIFQTENRVTMPPFGSGSAGRSVGTEHSGRGRRGNCGRKRRVLRAHVRDWHACFVKVIKSRHRTASPVDPEDVRRAAKGKKIKIIGLAHGRNFDRRRYPESKRIEARRRSWRASGGGHVASLSACRFNVDRDALTILLSGRKKAISAPPGMSPITVVPAAEKFFATQDESAELVFDLTTAMNYWGKDRLHHHHRPSR